MELKGYTVKRGKYISIKAKGQQRFVRLKTLGEDYSELSLVSRIRWKDEGANYALAGEPAPIRAEQSQLNICKHTLHNNNIKSHSDIDRLKSLQQETNKKIAALKNSLESCKQLYEVYTNIAKTYHDIVSEDYISKIIMQNPKFVKTYNHIKNIHPRI